jgi:hypothetical protein
MRNCCHGVAIIKTFNKLAIEKNFIKEHFTLKLLIATAEVLRIFNKLTRGIKFLAGGINEQARGNKIVTRGASI